RAEYQTGYQVQVASSAVALQQDHPDLWDSGKISSGQSALVPYAGKPLRSHSWYFWRVRIWDGQDRSSAWSKAGRWATGVLHPDDWQGAWIASSHPDEQNDGASVWFRYTFELDKGQAASALCSIASVGYHELYVNGRKVGDDVMAPAISDLSKRALSVTRDIAPYLQPGTNCIGLWLGQGWAGHTGKSWYAGSKLVWASEPRFLLQAQIQ